jgi:glycosyltransferase involved in cell wall biosynthesis
VHVLPGVAPTEIASFIASADLATVLFHPLNENLRHCLPNRFFSALAAGLPLLYSAQLPDLAATARAHDLGIPVDMERPDSIAAAIGSLLADPGLLERQREASRRARSALSWEAEEGQLDRILSATLET